MKHRSRFMLVLAMILGSALYGALVAANATTGIAIAVGYVAVLMTIFFYNEYWSHKHDT